MNPLEQLRCVIRNAFQQLGAASPNSTTHETVLIRDGYYCGRRFDCEGLRAVWFAEENQVKVYDRDGNMVNVCKSEDLFMSERSRVA